MIRKRYHIENLVYRAHTLTLHSSTHSRTPTTKSALPRECRIDESLFFTPAKARWALVRGWGGGEVSCGGWGGGGGGGFRVSSTPRKERLVEVLEELQPHRLAERVHVVVHKDERAADHLEVLKKTRKKRE